MKDIFIDTNIASRFTNPIDPEYKKLIEWLQTTNKGEKEDMAHLVVSQKLLVEYHRSAMNAFTSTCIPVLISMLNIEGRLNKISNDEVKQFKHDEYTKKQLNLLRCNNEDRELIPVVMLSSRKMALTQDDNFLYDLENFPGYIVSVEKRPENLNYK